MYLRFWLFGSHIPDSAKEQFLSLLYSCFEKGSPLANGEKLTRQCRKLLWVMVFFLWVLNRPFPSSLVALFQSESKCETILMKMTLICMKKKLRVELIFIWKVSHLDSLWNRGTRTQKWPIELQGVSAWWKETAQTRVFLHSRSLLLNHLEPQAKQTLTTHNANRRSLSHFCCTTFVEAAVLQW